MDKETDISLDFYLYLSKREQQDHFRLHALFVTFPKSQIVFFTFLFLFTKSAHNFLGKDLGEDIFHALIM